MAPITETIEINRSPDDVFAYVEDLTRHGEWQEGIVSVTLQTDGPTHVGTRAVEVRRIGGREQTQTYEITEHDPPRRFGFRGVDGSIRAVGGGTVEPLDGGARSRLTLDIDFEGHGMGKLMLPMVRREAGKQIAKDQQKLKQQLESGASGAAAAPAAPEAAPPAS